MDTIMIKMDNIMDMPKIPPSSLAPTEKTLKEEGRLNEARPESAMVGSKPSDNEIFTKEYVVGAFELAEMLDMVDKGQLFPSKGLSFRACNHKYYDFIDYWMAMVKNIKEGHQNNNALTQGYLVQEETLDGFEINLESLYNVIHRNSRFTTRWLIGLSITVCLSIGLNVFLFAHAFL